MSNRIHSVKGSHQKKNVFAVIILIIEKDLVRTVLKAACMVRKSFVAEDKPESINC